jgi:hypothetical protein
MTVRPVAPALRGAALIGFAGYAAVLLSGAITGARRLPLGIFIDALLLFVAMTLAFALTVKFGGGDVGTPWPPSDTDRFFGTVGNANVAGALYGALTALGVSRLQQRRHEAGTRRAWSMIELSYLLLIMLFLGGCFLTASRTGAALACGGSVAALLLCRPRAGEGRGKRRRAPRWLLIGAPIAVVAAFVALGLLDLLGERFNSLGPDFAVRQILWRHNWATAMRSPLTGYGLGSFPEVNTRFLGDMRTAAALWMTNAPHNILIRLVIDAGLPYLALIAAAGLSIVVRIGLSRRGRGLDADEVGLIIAVAVIGLAASVDITLEVPAMAATMLMMTGLLWGRAIGTRR